MNWISRDGGELTKSGDYRIARLIPGYSAWIYSDSECRRLAHEIKTLAAAQQLCEEHAKNCIEALSPEQTTRGHQHAQAR